MFVVFPDTSAVADYVSATLVNTIKSKPDAVLGAATGGTMEPIYACFIDKVRQQQLDVSRLTFFNLDEYVGLGVDHSQSYAAYMREHLFRHLSFNAARLYLPDGQAKSLEEHCRDYSARMQQHGGTDLQLLGVGSNGHIGFNEPGTAFDSRCHVVELSERTRIDNSRFFAEDEIVPASAITMGMQDIMDAREVLLVATGKNKAPILARYFESEVTEAIPFTILKKHPRVKIILDEAAASLLPARVFQRAAAA
ncbi:glucosamine-6-phosphate deaminase [Allopusillimonas ginsengisoli]|uniref:glucosamine-6-phosphate deaminase n=1 Tax=Allopusillimonas ginsengisoli TaxID=453575 RepID=UPI0010C20E55|nr:glucosamine-6-phosphate deaminase [Allopusillimonas ginsengisoli]